MSTQVLNHSDLRPGMTILRVDKAGMRPTATKHEVTFAVGGCVKGYRLNAAGERVGAREAITTGFMVEFKAAS